MAIGTNWSVERTSFHRLPMHAREINVRDLSVASSTGLRDVQVINRGTRVAVPEDSVTSMTIGTACRRSITICQGAPMHALPVQLHGRRKRDLVAREEFLVAVASGASIGHIPLGHRRGPID